MPRKKKVIKQTAAALVESVVAYKGFGTDWRCRGMQYELGKTYEHTGPVVPCESGLHACERPLDVLLYYPPATSRFAVVRASGEIQRHTEDSKIAAARLTIEAEIGLPDLVQRTIDWVIAHCRPSEGSSTDADRGAASATGESGAASATGYRGAASATGKSGAAMASGRFGRAMGSDGCAIFLVYRDEDWNIVHARAAIVGQGGIKPHTWYQLDADGNFEECA